MNGKQHGLGVMKYLDKAGQEKSKKGVWEEGKRSKWLSDIEIQMIQQDQTDFRTLLTQESNKIAAMVSPLANSFEQPAYFENQISLIENIFK